MKTSLSGQDWLIARFDNYRTKLQLSPRKARKRLMIFHPNELAREYDRICDSPFWSNKEPGISHEQRKKRTAQMYKPAPPKPVQLKLFNH